MILAVNSVVVWLSSLSARALENCSTAARTSAASNSRRCSSSGGGISNRRFTFNDIKRSNGNGDIGRSSSCGRCSTDKCFPCSSITGNNDRGNI